jgi:E3 ubiquitin-protein ligase TRIP12
LYLTIDPDGAKVVAQTPEGTRVATPTPQRDAQSEPSSSARASYAAAIKSKPVDWHLEFSIEDHPISLETTIYGAIHQHEARKAMKPPLNLSAIWSAVYTIKFKKVPGPSPIPESEIIINDLRTPCSHPRLGPVEATVSASPAIPEDSLQAQVLQLLRVLHKINRSRRERTQPGRQHEELADSAFVNNKLTAKLNRQLEEPMIVAR